MKPQPTDKRFRGTLRVKEVKELILLQLLSGQRQREEGRNMGVEKGREKGKGAGKEDEEKWVGKGRGGPKGNEEGKAGNLSPSHPWPRAPHSLCIWISFTYRKFYSI